MKKSILKKLAFLATAALLLVSLLPASAVVAAPLPPTGLLGVAVAGGRVDLYWTDNSLDETGFNVERAPDIGGLGPGTYAHIGPTPTTVLADVHTYTDTTVVQKTAYWYRVTAINATGPSLPSNEVRILTPVSAPQITLTQPAGNTFTTGAQNTVQANTSISGSTINSVEYQLVADNAPGSFNAKDIYAATLDLRIPGPRAPGPYTNNTEPMPAGLPAGSIAEFEISGTVSALPTANGVWTIGSVVAGHPEYTQPFIVYERALPVAPGDPPATVFVGSRHPTINDGVKIIAYRNATANAPLVAKEIRYIAPAQPAGAPSLALSFLINGLLEATSRPTSGPLTGPGYLVSGEVWTVGGGKFRIDSPDFPAYIDANVVPGINVAVRFATPPTQANVARYIFNQVTTAIQTTTNVNTVFDNTPIPLNAPDGTWLYIIVDGVVSGVDLVTGTWTIGNEGIMCYQTAQTLVAPSTVGDEVLMYCRRTMTPGPLVIEQIHNILPGPLIQPYKATALEVHLMYNGTIQTMGPNTWTIAGPAGTPVTFIVDDPEGKAYVDPMPLAAFNIGNPVTVEFEHVGEVLPDNANWAPMTTTAPNVWTAQFALEANTINPVAQSGTLFVRATDAAQQSKTVAFQSILARMPTAVPNAPTLAQPVQTTTNQVTVSWTAATTGELASEFLIERAPDSAGVAGTYAQINTATVTASPFVDTTVTSGNTYWYRVKAKNVIGPSTPSNALSVQVLNVPATPSNLNAGLLTATSVGLTWTDNASNETGYRVERAPDVAGQPGTFVAITTAPAHLAANTTSYTDLTITAGNIYHYRVIAFSTVLGDSAPSNVAMISNTPPAPPSGITITVTASITIAWTDNSNNETGFQVLRAPDNAGAPGTFAPVVDPGNPTPANATSFVDTTVVQGNIYWYEVVALGPVVGDSTPVVSSSGILNDVPAVPTTLAGTAAYPQITLTWTDNASNESSFRLDRATTAAFDANLLTRSVPANADTSASYTDTTVSAGTTYYYRVAAINGLSADPPAFTDPPVPIVAASAPSGGGGGGGGGFVFTYVVSLSGMTGDITLMVDASGVVQSTTVVEDAARTFVLNIPSGTKLLTASGSALSQMTHTIVTTPPAAPAGKVIVGSAHSFGPDGATFTPSMTMVLKYAQASLPAGVSEDQLGIWYWDGAAWVAVTSQVTAASDQVSASVTHFSTYALLAPLPPPPPTTPPPAAPAQFSIVMVTVSPLQSNPGGTINVLATATNTGGTSGQYEVVLTVDGVRKDSKTVTLAAGASSDVTFSFTAGSAQKIYVVDVNGKQGNFTVRVPEETPEPTTPVPTTPTPTPTPTPIPGGTNWWLIGGIIGAVILVVLLVTLTMRRRHP